MSEIPKTYTPADVEARWYSAWEAQGAFAARRNPQREPYTILIPPPNVTGMLHMGHILNNTLQDIFIRRARLEGREALWFPGMDHAGIATQTRVEKRLREQGTTRRDLGREAFVEEVWRWKEEHGGIILRQLRTLGASCDWERSAFTLDPGYTRAVRTAFVQLFERGYLYRGWRMSNWCPATQTALSNEEVIMKPQQSVLYTVRYEVLERPGEVLDVATTRPETIPGDVAVALHPDDPRRQRLQGKHVWRPLKREPIPILFDDAIDPEFGTGALKVTPAHDPVDYALGLRHDLPVVDTFNPDGTLNDAAGELAGLERFEARKASVELLRERGLLVEEKPYENNVGFSERADVPIEPRLTEQWWLRYPKVAEARQVLEATGPDGRPVLNIHPARWAKTYLHWLETMEQEGIDWCVSRQLWWGHQIPVWYRKGLDRSALTPEDYRDPGRVHVSVDGPPDPENWVQEEDVLDTWASSWLWPLANFGWPDNASEDLSYFYPTQLLVTGFDIIFLWVARMVMAGLEFRGPEQKTLDAAALAERIPFRDVYITGLIRDGQGRKMSKSLGNSPDPLELIAQFGADALRYGIVSIAPKGQDIRYEFTPAQGDTPIHAPSAELGRNVCNKLWNAARFRAMSGPLGPSETLDALIARLEPASLDAYDSWILQRLLDTLQRVEEAFTAFEMHPYPQQLYEFFWSDYCDWYVEAAKTRLGDPQQQGHVLAVLDLCLRHTLLLAQPLMPFICEELWERLGFRPEGHAFLQETRLPTARALAQALADGGLALRGDDAAAIESIKEAITRARALKAEYNVAARRDVEFKVVPQGTGAAQLEAHRDSLLKLIPAGALTVLDAAPEGLPAAVSGLGTFYLELEGLLDLDAERERLTKELAKLDKGLRAGEAKLQNRKFLDKAPPEVVEGARAQLEATRNRQQELMRLLKSLGGG